MVDFNKIVNRRNTGCEKWDKPAKEYNNDEIIPMWVADMDFAVADEIIEALNKRLTHHVFGYQAYDESYEDAFVQHFNTHCHHHINKDQVLLSTGVVYSMNACIQLLSNENDKIIIHSPAYPPFRSIIEKNHRCVVDSKMKIINGKYTFDFDDLEKQVDEHCKLFMLCNPQNPTGRIFSREELVKVAEFAQRHHLLIIADEIHADFIYDNAEFTPIMDINDYTLEHTITCVSCTKSFNLAALNVSAVFIKNKALYQQVKEYMSLNGLQSINVFGLEAMKAAYTKSEYWLEELKGYLQENRDYAYTFIQQNLPKIKVLKPEATYLMWLDLRSYHIKDVQKALSANAGVYTNDGSNFGKEYAGFIRFNFACPRSQLIQALKQMQTYLHTLE